MGKIPSDSSPQDDQVHCLTPANKLVEVHTFDPDGDLVLQLLRYVEITAEHAIDKQDTGGSNQDVNPNEDAGREATPPDSTSATNTNEAGLDTTPEAFADDLDSEDGQSHYVNVHMVVSSRHLMLASPVFKAMLSLGVFKEGQKLEFAGKAEIPLPDDDPEAFIILLGIIHGRNRQIPRQISLDLLARITILVDKYQMVEAAEVFADAWIKTLKTNLPTHYITEEDQSEVHKWMAISWVFSKPEEFQDMTQLVERSCGFDLDQTVGDDLPIPKIIIDTIAQKRSDALFQLYALVEQTIRRYQRLDIHCPRTRDIAFRPKCDALLLGSLSRSAIAAGMFPVPKSPYGEKSYNDLFTSMNHLEAEAICDSISPWRASDPHKFGHGFKDLVQERLREVEERLSGLDMDDFKKPTQGPSGVVPQKS